MQRQRGGGRKKVILEHVGIVVRSLEEGMEIRAQAFGYAAATHPVTNTRQKVRVAFLERANSVMVKLVEPTDDSSLVFALARRGGG